jgi:hypothetical protein
MTGTPPDPLDEATSASEEADGSSRGWVAQDDYRMLSMAFTVASMDGRFAEGLRWHLAPFRLPAPAQGGFPVDLIIEEPEEGQDRPMYLFRLATEERYRSSVLTAVFGRAVGEIHAAVPQRARDFLSLHAGAVARNGDACLLPADMERGKSSLVLALLRAGFSYLSDEVGAIDPVTGRAYPFPKRIKLAPTALPFFPGLEAALRDRDSVPFRLWERYIGAEDVGARVAEPSAVRWLVFPTPDWDGPARLEPVSQSEAVRRMAESSFNLYRYGERGVVLLSRIAAGAPAFELRGGTPADRADLISDRLV